MRLSGTLVTGGSVSAFALAADQIRVLYLADERVNNVVELYARRFPAARAWLCTPCPPVAT